MAKWTQSHVERHCCGHSGQILHANDVSDTLRSGGGRATRKKAKYAEIIQSHHFVPIAIETLGPINMDGQRFLDRLGIRLSSVSGDPRETTFLYQRLSVLIQIFSSGAFRGTLLPDTVTEG